MIKTNNKKSGKVKFSSVVRAPVAQQVVLKYKKPTFTTLSNGDVKISHREYIQDVVVPGDGFRVIASIPIQPGLGQSFPWLNRLASNFESYKFESLQYRLTTMSATTSNGSFGMAIDYDAADAAPTTKVQLLAMEGSTRGPVWQPELLLRANSNALNKLKERYVRTTASPANTDIKTYDVGTLYVSSDGNAPLATMAELHVEYTVILKTPQIGDLSGVSNSSTYYVNSPTPLSSNPDWLSSSVWSNSNFNSLAERYVPDNSPYKASYSAGSTNERHELRFREPGHYMMTMSLHRPSTEASDTAFEFPTEGFGNVRGRLLNRAYSGMYDTLVTLMFDVVRSGATLAMTVALRSINRNRNILLLRTQDNWMPQLPSPEVTSRFGYSGGLYVIRSEDPHTEAVENDHESNAREN